jgi:hypothetical protein
MILDISGKAAKALHQYIKLVITNYELAMDEQNAAIRRKWLIAGWHAACAAETYVSDHSAKLKSNELDKEWELRQEPEETKPAQSQGAAD